MIRGKTSTGFEFEIDEIKLDDMEFLDALAEVDENPLKFSKVMKIMLGEEQRERLYDHLRTDDGRVPIDAANATIIEIMEYSQGETKNS